MTLQLSSMKQYSLAVILVIFIDEEKIEKIKLQKDNLSVSGTKMLDKKTFL